MMKKQLVVAFALLLAIPVVVMAGGTLSSLINPEIAARSSNYVRNFHLLSMLKMGIFFASLACAAALWLLSCTLVLRSKKRSPLWLLLAPLGPLGFAVLAVLNDRDSAQPDAYTRFLRSMNLWVRIGYEACTFVVIWMLAYQAMVVNRELIIQYQAITQGVSTQQVRDIQNASGGMWAFSEGMEIMFIVVLFYILRPILFCIAAGVRAKFVSAKAQ
jgi:hypothetical protein